MSRPRNPLLPSKAERVQAWRAQNPEKVRATQQQRTAARVAAGLCIRCHQPNPDPSRQCCPPCAESNRQRAQRRRDATHK